MTHLSREEQLRDALRKSSHIIQDLETALAAYQEPIAIIGMACRFPGAEGIAIETPEQYWQFLQTGREAVGQLPTHRLCTTNRPDAEAPIVLQGNFLSEVEGFDANFFGISPREALFMDPQQRLALEVAWEALEAAHIVPATLSDSETGVFLGVYNDDYARMLYDREDLYQQNSLYVATGNLHSVTAGRIAYTLGFIGPALAIDTACSSSLVALHQACQSLRNQECSMALAGGVHLILHENQTSIRALTEEHMYAADGRCKTFDAAGDGFGRGEGCGMVVLKRLSDAQAAGDTILALIRGSMTNQDGHSSGLTAPSGPSQQRVIRRALENAGLEPQQIGYIEAHGTGTNLGDPIEIGALNAVFGQRTAPLWVGSVKTNFGHLEATAGVAGVMKVVLALQHGQIPPHRNLKNPNPHIDWANSSIQIPHSLIDWPEEQRNAGVSSFGISGTNAHVILSAAPVAAAAVETHFEQTERPTQLFTFSAKSEAALCALANKYCAYLGNDAKLDFDNLAYSTHVARSHFAHRLAIGASSPSELQTKLTAYTTQPEQSAVVTGVLSQSLAQPRVAFLFTGQGSQYVGMGRELYATSPTFRATLDRCDVILQECLGRSLLDLLYPTTPPDHNDLMESHPCGQAANFAIECALADLWRSWGVQPSAVLGHSLGDFAAAYTAGLLSLEDGLRLVTERGRLMEQAPGSMVSVLASEAEVAPFTAQFADVTIGVINGPRSVVLSGGHANVTQVTEQLQTAGFKTHKLAIPVAAHSPMLAPVLDAFEAAVRKVTLSNPQLPVVSSMTGQLINDELTDPVYWRKHLRNTVRFADGVQTLHDQGCTVFLEIGPKPALLGMVEQVLDKMSSPTADDSIILSSGHRVMLPSLRKHQSDWQQMLASLGELYVRGAAIDWQGFDRDYHRRKVTLPTYPFQRQRYWVEPAKQDRHKRAATALRPLVDRMLKLPRQKQTVFESAFSIETLPFLADHKVFDTVISPGACQLATVLTGADVAFAAGAIALSDVLLPQALVIPTATAANGAGQGEERTVQVILSPIAANGCGPQHEFTLLSFDPTNPEVEPPTHATGYLATPPATPPAIDLATLQQRFDDENLVVIDAMYTDNVATTAIALGPSFQWITRLWRQETDGRNETLAQLHLPAVIEDFADYLLHPGLLDACFQAAGATTNEEAEGAMLPFALHSLYFYKPQRTKHSTAETPTWWCHATQVGAHKWDITLLDGAGTLLAAVDGFEIRQATPAAIQHQDSWRDWLYAVAWQERPFFGLPLDYLPAPDTLSEGMAEQLSSQQTSVAYQRQLQLYATLETLSTDYVLAAFAKAGVTFQVGQRWQLQQVARQLGVIPQYHRLLARLLALLTEAGLLTAEGEAWRVVAVPAVADPQNALTILQADYGNLPELRLLARCGERLGEVLRGVQEPLELLFPGGNDETVRQLYTQSPVIQAVNNFMAQTMTQIVAQLPAGRGLRILEIGAGTGSTTTALLPHLPTSRTDYLFTDIGPTFLSQAAVTFADYEFVRYQVLDIEQAPDEQGFAHRQADLVVAANVLHATKDLAEALTYTRQLLAPGGLLLLLEGTTPSGFTDLTFGLTDGWWRFADSRQEYPLLTADQWTTLLQTDGFVQVATTEIAGQAVIVAQVAELTETGAERGPIGREAWLLFADRQGIAVALADQLRQQGKRALLVEAGAAYAQIGDATFQIDPDAAADYRRLLAAIPQVQQIVHLWSLDTPTRLDTTDLVAAAQQGCGTVLHLIQALLHQRIAPSGLWLVTQAAQAVIAGERVAGVAQSPLWGMGKVIGLEHPELNCRLLDLDDTAEIEEAARATLLYAAINGNRATAPMAEGQKVLHETAFAVRNTPQGAGCYVPRLARAAVEPTQTITISKEATYLITGGLGGVGLEIAHWLAEQGAGQLILLGRSAPKAEIMAQLDQIRTLGTQLTIAQVDVTDRRQLATLLAGIDAHRPLRGIIHAVGVLDDGALLQQHRERFVPVLAPKVQGAWYLHELTQMDNLDFFVLFSSATGLLGNWGQANHAAANAFLDTFAHYRQAQGLPALSINWGAWSEVGAAAELVRTHQQQMGMEGIGFIPPVEGVAAFAALLQQATPQAGVLPITWSRYSQADRAQDPFYADFVHQPTSHTEQASEPQRRGQHLFSQQLAAASATERKGLLVSHVQAAVAKILGMSASPAAKVGFTELGMDSLMAIELRRQLEKGLQISLPSTVAFEYPTSDALALYILEHILQFPTETSPNGDQALKDIEQLSDNALLSLVGQAFAELV